MSFPSSLSDYYHSLQWSSLTSSIPTDPRACLSSISASTFCCLPYLPFWPFSRFADYNDFDVDDNISTSSSTWQPPPSALNSFSYSSASQSSSSSSSSASPSSSLYRVSQPIAQPVFSSHLASATFSSPDQLASVLAMQQDDDGDSRRDRIDKDRRRKDDRAAHAMTSDMRSSSRSSDRSPSSHSSKSHNKSKSKSSKRSHRGNKTRRGDKEPINKPLNAPRSSALSASPSPPPPSIHQDEDMSDSELSTDEESELSGGVDRHERALVGIVSKPAAIY